MPHPLEESPDKSEYAPNVAEYVSRVRGGNVLDMLERQGEETAELVRSLPSGMAEYRYAPDKWTITQVIGHLGDAERIFSYRALRFSRGDATPIAGFEENSYVREAPFLRIPIADLLSELQHLRRATLYLFRNLDEAALMRHGLANGFETTVRALAFITAGHEHHHLEVLRTRYLV